MFIHIILYIFFNMQSINSIFEFNSNCDIDNWQIINDVVMGGRSTASLFVDENQGQNPPPEKSVPRHLY